MPGRILNPSAGHLDFTEYVSFERLEVRRGPLCRRYVDHIGDEPSNTPVNIEAIRFDAGYLVIERVGDGSTPKIDKVLHVLVYNSFFFGDDVLAEIGMDEGNGIYKCHVFKEITSQICRYPDGYSSEFHDAVMILITFIMDCREYCYKHNNGECPEFLPTTI